MMSEHAEWHEEPFKNSTRKLQAEHKIKLAVFYPSETWNEGPAYSNVVNFALEKINDGPQVFGAGSDGMPVFQLEANFYESKCSGDYAMKQFREVWETKDELGILGPPCSVGLEPVATAAPFVYIHQISGTASLVSLDKPSSFPYLFRTMPIETTRWMVTFCHYMGWKKIAFIGGQVREADAASAGKRAHDLGIEIPVMVFIIPQRSECKIQGGYPDEYYPVECLGKMKVLNSAAQQILDEYIRVVIMSTYGADAKDVMCARYLLGTQGSRDPTDMIWVTYDWLGSLDSRVELIDYADAYAAPIGVCEADAMRSMAKHHILTGPPRRPQETDRMLACMPMTAKELRSAFESKYRSAPQTISFEYFNFVTDAVCLWALAARTVMMETPGYETTSVDGLATDSLKRLEYLTSRDAPVYEHLETVIRGMNFVSMQSPDFHFVPGRGHPESLLVVQHDAKPTLEIRMTEGQDPDYAVTKLRDWPEGFDPSKDTFDRPLPEVIESGLEPVHVIAPIIAVILLGTCIICAYRRFFQKKIGNLQSELNKLKDSMVGVRVVKQEYCPDDAVVQVAPTKRSKWYWAEDQSRLSAHNVNDIIQPGNFVSYAGSVTADMEEHYTQFLSKVGPPVVKMDLTDRIASTGTEMKAFAADSGVKFEIDFVQMVQRNIKTGYERKIKRTEVLAAPVPSKLGAGSQEHRALLASNPAADTSMPAEISGQPRLVHHVGQLIQTSKQRPDNWAFGSVVYDELEDRPPIAKEGLSADAGWFHMDCTDLPTNEDLRKLQNALGGGGADILKPPPYWQDVKDPLVAQLFEVQGEERQRVIDKFMVTLTPQVKVQKVMRVQCFSLWQSYAVKRQTVITNEKQRDDKVIESQLEKVWLFHGTTQDIADKICQQGFNRSFCGRNATFYGKGVYFARDASYSSNKTYSNPDSSGVQRIFMCRVLCGRYCRGVKDAVAPDVREGHHLYDSTVDNMKDPSIFVTYHDAQVYPEYLVLFKQ